MFLVFLTAVYLLNIVIVIIYRNQPEEVGCHSIPKLEIELSDISLSELNTGDKETKYSGNTALISTCASTNNYENVEIKGRGNTTWGQPKNPYQIKFESKEDLFGMGKARKWILLANYLDESNMRTDIAYYFEQLLGEEYALSGEFVELIINGEDLGLYYLSPKIEIGKSRVDLKDPLGILMELDNLHKDEEHYVMSGNRIQLKDLVADDNEEEAVADFRKSISKFVSYARKNDLAAIDEVVDIDSMVIYYLLSEFTINPDSFSSSFFMYKDGPQDKIHFGPGWDFDYSMGNKKWIWADADNYYSPFEMSIVDNNNAVWFLNDPEFFELVGKMYREKLMGRKEEVLDYFDKRAEYIHEAATDDAEKWEYDFESELEYLREWISTRFDYFDEIYGGLGELDKHML